MVAVPVSQHNSCPNCQARLTDFVAQSVCPGCGLPQPLSSDETYFGIFGIGKTLNPDLKDLETRFYKISRSLHPDRFSTAKLEVKAASMQRMSFLNEAYRTLRDTSARRSYLLKIENIAKPAKTSMPMDLAEQWFELQDRLHAPNAGTAINTFVADLEKYELRIHQNIARLENEYEKTQSSAVLEELAKAIEPLNTLESLKKDVERIKFNAHSN